MSDSVVFDKKRNILLKSHCFLYFKVNFVEDSENESNTNVNNLNIALQLESSQFIIRMAYPKLSKLVCSFRIAMIRKNIHTRVKD